MAQCGTKVTDEVISAFDEVKQKHKYKYVTFKAEGKPGKDNIIVDTKVESSTFEEFQASFPSHDARWSIYDFDYKNREGQDCNKLILVSWLPDSTAIKTKMLQSGVPDAIKKTVNCPAFFVHADCRDDLNFDKVRDAILKTSQ
ncbi:actophorin-like [Branchiostoma floridae]|uniref:Actophorin-like n=1 Tax=Branchiostoma floridae TaxID=7739 RepID=A0A9J7NDP5_BRAFL|nr:actophorin-like [Branchiostoma floridae]